MKHVVPRCTVLPGQLLPEHARIFNLLLEVNQRRGVGAVLRVAGGWVRDSLLGVPSQDIDLALESTQPDRPLVTGAVFANEVAAMQQELNLPAATISVIKTNPDKSKHLETAQMTLFGLSVEFCNLRHDAYCKETRVPVVRPGTPLEDALRRDFTVNALFYNLHTQTVEDYTTGLEDLASGVLRCPLDPTETFLDDPLRLLRGVRFAGQLGFRLDPSIEQCLLGHPEIRQTLHTKLSRERIGIEVGKMLSGRTPSLCVDLMARLMVLFEVCLMEVTLKKAKGKTASAEVESVRDPLLLVPPPRDAAEAVAHAATLRRSVLLMAQVVLPLLEQAGSIFHVPPGPERCIAALFALLLPLYGCPLDGGSLERDERLRALCQHGLKFPAAVDATVFAMIEAALKVAEGTALAAQQPSGTGRLEGPAREAVFAGLSRLVLDKKTVHATFLRVALLGAVCLQRDVEAMAQQAGPAAVAAAGQALLASLTADPQLLLAPVAPLPIAAADLKTVYGLEGKTIGLAVAAQRLFVLHCPMATAADVIAHLRTRGLCPA